MRAQNSMAEKRDYYEVLGVNREATVEEITKCYRQLALKHHPDRNPGDDQAATYFKEVSEAYEVLRDSEKRSRYDRFGHQGIAGSVPNFDDEDVLSGWLGGLGDILGSFFGGGGFGGQRRAGPRRGRDLEIAIEINLLEAAQGVTKIIRVPKQVPCQDCQGQGTTESDGKRTCTQCNGHGAIIQNMGIVQVQQPCPVCRKKGYIITKPCNSCRGQGRVVLEDEVEVAIPAGMPHGAQIQMRGRGEDGQPGAAPGNLFVVVHVQRHPVFEREGDDLACQIPITMSQAALGAEIEIPTIEGQMIRQELPKGIQSYESMTIRGQGVPNVRSGRRGNLHVQIVVETPRKLTKRQEELFRELAELEEVNVSPQRKNWFDKVRDFFGSSDNSAEN